MGPTWTGSRYLLTLILLRFVVAGLQQIPQRIFLIGASQFRVLARYIEFELIAGLALSLPLVRFGSTGVAAAFLIATVFGTFYPILSAYSKILGYKSLLILRGIWVRGLFAFTVSIAVAALLLSLFSGRFSVVAGVIGAGVGISLPFAFGYLRFRKNDPTRLLEFDLKELLARI